MDKYDNMIFRTDDLQNIPLKERNRIRDKKIRALYKLGYSMDQIVIEFKRLGFGVSKSTVFYAIKGRDKKSLTKKGK